MSLKKEIIYGPRGLVSALLVNGKPFPKTPKEWVDVWFESPPWVGDCKEFVDTLLKPNTNKSTNSMDLPRLDIVESTGSKTVVALTMPGLDPANVSISATPQQILVRIQMPDKQVRTEEIPWSPLFSAPFQVDGIKAEYKFGVLTITVPHESRVSSEAVSIPIS